jgi:hypothetical protein
MNRIIPGGWDNSSWCSRSRDRPLFSVQMRASGGTLSQAQIDVVRA